MFGYNKRRRLFETQDEVDACKDGLIEEIERRLGDFWQRFYLLDSLPLDGGGRGWG